MALTPCVYCNARYAGKTNYAYLAAVDGLDAKRDRLGLCPRHAEELMLRFAHGGWWAEEDHQVSNEDCSQCILCLHPITAQAVMIYVTLYLNGKRGDGFARAHRACVWTDDGLAEPESLLRHLEAARTPLEGPQAPLG